MNMDYAHSVEALIPGVHGRVLGALARTQGDLSMRQVAKLAAVSPTQASEVLGRLGKLGVIQRRDVGRSALVRLDRSNAAGRLIERLATLHGEVLEQLRDAAADIAPTPAALVVFGSFARGQATPESDVDVLAVRPKGIGADDEQWVSSLGHWADLAGHIAGNPVNLIDVALSDVRPRPKLDGRLWRNIKTDGISLVGPDPEDILKP
jgi:DNA-binding MarR family transcriptional regulator